MSIRQVTRWETEDGQTFITEEEARIHENRLKFLSELSNSDLCIYGNIECSPEELLYWLGKNNWIKFNS